MLELTIEQQNELRLPFLSLAVETRQLLERDCASYLVEKTYGAGSDVPGYKGWRELPAIGVTSFIRDDGSVQYDW